MDVGTVDLILRVITLLLFTILVVYWYISGKKASEEKPKSISRSISFERIFIFIGSFFVIVNLLGITVFRFDSLFLKVFGFVLVLIGFFEAMAGRVALGANWTQSYEYQIKKNHQLIQNGIYAYVRHPIYGGMLLGSIGALMISGSYIFISAFVLVFFVLRLFAQREEKLLTKGFGKKYTDYIKKTKMLIPFLY